MPKVAKRRRICSQASSCRWSNSSEKNADKACQVDFEEHECKSMRTAATQTEWELGHTPESDDCEMISPEKLQCAVDAAGLQSLDLPCASEESRLKNNSHEAAFVKEEEITSEVKRLIEEKEHKLEELTNNPLQLKSSSIIISDSEVLRNAAIKENKCNCCGKSGTLKFLNETEERTGVLKLELICAECDKTSSLTSNDEIIRTRTKPKTFLTNYIMLTFIVCGEYYKDYDHIMGTLGIGHFTPQQWIRVIEWIAPEVDKIAKWSIQQARYQIRARGDAEKLEVMFDGFYLTRGHYSNNASATMHDAKTGKIIGYAHRTKRGEGANWEGTSGGAEGNMLDEILVELIDKEKMKIKKAIIDKDAACQEVLLSRSPETDIVYCGNHTAKTFHTDLERVKKTPCQCKSLGLPKCKRMSDAMITNAKKCLKNLTKCEEIYSSEDPMGDFGKAILNYYAHYTDDHSSTWCRFHKQEDENGEPYHCKHSFNCPAQLKEFKTVLEKMASRPQEYITLDGRVTNNIPEGYHGIALVYRNKQIDLGSIHYKCKTNMSIPHKNIGPIWIVLLFMRLSIPMPKKAVEYVIQRQEQYEKENRKRSSPDYQRKRNECKKKKMKKHEHEKDYMKSLKAVSVTTTYNQCSDSDDSESESSDTENSDQEELDPACCLPIPADSSDDELAEEMSDEPTPLYFLYDCEATGGSVYKDHIVEVAAVVQPLPDNVQSSLPTTFQSLVNTSKRIAAPVVRKCGIKQTDLLNQPKLSEVLPRFISWIKNLTNEVSNLTGRKYYPALLAHNGFVFDFPLLFAEVDRRYPLLTNKLFSHICFGDTLANLRTWRKQGKLSLDKKQKLGMAALHELYFPDEEFHAHRALEDAQAMKNLFCHTELKDLLCHYEPLLHTALEEKRKFKSMVQTREKSTSLLLKMGRTLSANMARKVASEGFDFGQLRNLSERLERKEPFMQYLRAKGLSRVCCQKLADFFFRS